MLKKSILSIIIILSLAGTAYAGFLDNIKFILNRPEETLNEHQTEKIEESTIFAGGTGTINQLSQWRATTSPFSAITTNVHAKNLYMPFSQATTSRMYSTTFCINNSSPDCITAWPAGGASWGQTWEINGSGQLTPTTTPLTVLTTDWITTNSTSTNATTTSSYSSNFADFAGLGFDIDLEGGANGISNIVPVLARVNEVGGITKGQAVYITGATGERPQVALADNTLHNPSHTLGIAQETGANNTDIRVVLLGRLENVDTSMYLEGDRLHLTTSGGMSGSPQVSGSHIHMGFVIKVNANTGIIQVYPEVYAHDFRATTDIDLRFAVGTDDTTSFGIFENYSVSELGWFNGGGQLAWGIGTTTASLYGVNFATTTLVSGPDTGANGDFDLTVGDTYGGLKLGNVGIYSSSFSASGMDLDKAVLFRQEGNLGVGNDPGIEFAWMEQGNTARLLIPEFAVGNATNLIRSAIVAGPYSQALGNDMVLCSNATWNFWAIDCDTSGTGPDLGVLDDFQVLGSSYFGETLTASTTLITDLIATNATTTNTTTTDFYVSGNSIFGDTANFANFNSTGDLTFSGTGDYLVDSDNYAFRAVADQDTGIFFNAVDLQIQTLDLLGGVAFSVDISNGRAGVATGTPVSDFDIYNPTATSTAYIYSGGSGFGARIIMEDEGGGACTAITTSAGIINSAVITCP